MQGVVGWPNLESTYVLSEELGSKLNSGEKSSVITRSMALFIKTGSYNPLVYAKSAVGILILV